MDRGDHAGFVIHLGDITADVVSDLEAAPRARAIFGTLSVPVRFLPGNDDIGEIRWRPRHPRAGKSGGERGFTPLPPPGPRAPGRLCRSFGPDRWSFEAARGTSSV